MTSVSILKDPSRQALHNQTITLSDDRQLGYAEFGSQSADAPVILTFHGFPGSRLEPAIFHNAATELNLRVIGIDRPGHGLSSPQPGRKLLDWPADVRALARRLNIDRYYVLGYSGGGPYALACAHQLPETEMLGVGVLSSVGPWHFGTAGMDIKLRVLFNALAWAPWLARLIIDTSFTKPVHEPDPIKMKALTDNLLASMAPADREFCGKPETLDIMMTSFRESFKHGSDAAMEEGRIITTDWGFELGQISAPNVRLWHGSADHNTPVSMGRYLAEQIPRVQYKEYEGDSHYTIHYRLIEILQGLVGAGQ
ncbi:hypothetical protein N7492_004823 [Penicillium capsulatum]|uniref:AB hydrolase-1 domain-containing protein n=1 Tax=Penicillium capsulatum TaxID=69766 RepID=A0A9W9I8J4_9EURO|nr:hypothetical protein N7492_004823 [Penicillium capsulatum]KAJ6136068.1 hypothetical protein N7512_001228 [Penicillium capsulatum]